MSPSAPPSARDHRLITDSHAGYFANELGRRCSSGSVEKLTAVLADAQVDLNELLDEIGRRLGSASSRPGCSRCGGGSREHWRRARHDASTNAAPNMQRHPQRRVVRASVGGV